ncbi:MAG: DUF4302 domain-containing protein [Alistipes sp.]|nr:DUF4302 domain-containing protein [Alistipes sp.]
MKKLFLIPILALALTLSACVNKVEEVFDVPASERLEQCMIDCQKLLTSAEHGWMIQYYPSSSKAYGGSTYAAKFEANGDVTVTGDVAPNVTGDASKTITSHYSINASSSVVLTFDTFNDYIHYWADPDPYSKNKFEGDFEWAYVEGNAKQMVFRGIRTDNKIVFTALDTDIVSAIQQVVDLKYSVNDRLYMGFRMADGAELYDDAIYSVLTYYPDGNTQGAYEKIPYAYTPTGITFYEPATINGVTVQNFNWVEGSFVATDAKTASGAAAEVTIAGFHSEEFIHYDDFLGEWELNQNGTITTVTMKEKVRYQSYTLSKIGGFDVEVGYSKTDGSLSLTYQYVGRYKSGSTNYYAYLCPWDANAGYLCWTAGNGFVLNNIGEGDQLVMEFKDNGKWGSYTTNSILFSGWVNNTPGTGTRTNLVRLTYFKTLTKK